MAINQWAYFLREAGKAKQDLLSHLQAKNKFPAITVLLKADRLNDNKSIRFTSAKGINSFLLRDQAARGVVLQTLREVVRHLSGGQLDIMPSKEILDQAVEGAKQKLEEQKKAKAENNSKGGEQHDNGK